MDANVARVGVATLDDVSSNGIPKPPPPSSAAVRRTMQGNRGTGTKPETALRSALHAAGLRFRKDFRLDVGSVKARPDVVFTRAKVAVFVDGCYWHCCPKHGTQPRSNADYWTPKLARNVERDREQDAALRDAGWTVLRIWEHELVSDAAMAVAEAVRFSRLATAKMSGSSQ